MCRLRFFADTVLLSVVRSRIQLSELVAEEVCHLMQIRKLNTSGYHLQTDSPVERLHRTLISMLSMDVEKHARDWDRIPPFVLYAYQVTAQESTRESPLISYMAETLANLSKKLLIL